MKYDLSKMATFGVAGNFTGHLEQAGEAVDFTNVKTAEANAPKAMFPTYLPQGAAGETPDFLHTYPFDANRIVYPVGEQKVQLEPECAIIFRVTWENDQIASLTPVEFGASNDCSIRKEGAKKISLKKNWGAASKGFSEQRIAVDSFRPGSVLDDYRIASYLVRDGKAYPYGEDSAVCDYSYFYEKLEAWMLEKLNHQKNEGPAEEIHTYLLESGKPEYIMVSVGATRYTEYGCTNFLQNEDLSVVVVYPGSRYTAEEITAFVESGDCEKEGVSFLVQKVEL